ncbi:G2/mitotic-specific cyclin-B-like [Ptychodera flava]|uniref:G2/mitotic-specific cyclin-B-like n=1 Tax=Ptychodera flava TaxID=63121 RepID=UPI00396A88AB
MAFRATRNSSSTSLHSTRIGSNRENDVAAFKSKGQTTSRPALGTIGNVISVRDNKLKGKKEINKSTLSKGRNTSLKSISELAPNRTSKVAEKREERAKSPAPSLFECHTISEEVETEAAFSEQQLQNVEDIDKADHENPQLVSQYVNDIYKYMRHLEREYKVSSDYMEHQEINARMRAILIDWLVQVHLRFHLLQETLFLTISILDRFLQVQQVSRNKLQLVGVTAMFLASKYEEMYAPEIGDFVYITDNAYNKAQIRAMECLMLRAIDFSLGKPLCLHFLRRNSKAGGVDAQKHTLAKYLMELTLQEYDFVQYDPSEIAAAALLLSLKVLDDDPEWSDTLHYYSTYSEDELLPIVRKMCKLLVKSETAKLKAVKNKYASSKFMKISTLSNLNSSTVTELASQAT